MDEEMKAKATTAMNSVVNFVKENPKKVALIVGGLVVVTVVTVAATRQRAVEAVKMLTPDAL